MSSEHEKDRTAELKMRPDSELAWDRWFRAVYPKLFYIAFGKSSGNRSKAEDIVSESIERFIRYEGLSKVENDREATAYLLKTVDRLLVEESSRETKERSAHVESPWSENALRVTEALNMEQLLANLGEEDRLLMSLLIEGRTIKEVSELLRISYSAAGTRISRVREKLRNLDAEM